MPSGLFPAVELTCGEPLDQETVAHRLGPRASAWPLPAGGKWRAGKNKPEFLWAPATFAARRSQCGAEDLFGNAKPGLACMEKVRQVGEPVQGTGRSRVQN